jgi:hypothetical protein
MVEHTQSRLNHAEVDEWPRRALWSGLKLCSYHRGMRLRLRFSVACVVLIGGTAIGAVQALVARRFPYEGVLTRLRRAGGECAVAQLARGTDEIHIRVLTPALPAAPEQLQIEILPADPETEGCVRERFSELLGLPRDVSVEPALSALQHGLRFLRGQPEPAALKGLPPPLRDQWRRVAPLVCRAVAQCAAACEARLAAACWVLGNWHREGKHVKPDEQLAASYLDRACELGEGRACDLYQQGHDLTVAQIARVFQGAQPKLARCWRGVRRHDLHPAYKHVKPDEQLATSHLDRACELGEGSRSCRAAPRARSAFPTPGRPSAWSARWRSCAFRRAAECSRSPCPSRSERVETEERAVAQIRQNPCLQSLVVDGCKATQRADECVERGPSLL